MQGTSDLVFAALMLLPFNSGNGPHFDVFCPEGWEAVLHMVGGIICCEICIQEANPLFDVVPWEDRRQTVPTEVRPQDVCADVTDHSMVICHVEEIMSISLHIEDLMACKWMEGTTKTSLEEQVGDLCASPWS